MCRDKCAVLSGVAHADKPKCILSMRFGQLHCLLHVQTDGSEMSACESASACVVHAKCTPGITLSYTSVITNLAVDCDGDCCFE